MICWGHFSASLVAEYMQRHKANISRQMNKELFLYEVWKNTISKELNLKIGKQAWLLIDSTIKGKRGKKMHNLQRFRTSKGYTIGHCFVFALLLCQDGAQHIIAVNYPDQRSGLLIFQIE